MKTFMETYVRAVRRLREHYHKSPDLITEEELRVVVQFENIPRKGTKERKAISIPLLLGVFA